MFDFGLETSILAMDSKVTLYTLDVIPLSFDDVNCESICGLGGRVPLSRSSNVIKHQSLTVLRILLDVNFGF